MLHCTATALCAPGEVSQVWIDRKIGSGKLFDCITSEAEGRALSAQQWTERRPNERVGLMVANGSQTRGDGGGGGCRRASSHSLSRILVCLPPSPTHTTRPSIIKASREQLPRYPISVELDLGLFWLDTGMWNITKEFVKTRIRMSLLSWNGE